MYTCCYKKTKGKEESATMIRIRNNGNYINIAFTSGLYSA